MNDASQVRTVLIQTGPPARPGQAPVQVGLTGLMLKSYVRAKVGMTERRGGSKIYGRPTKTVDSAWEPHSAIYSDSLALARLFVYF